MRFAILLVTLAVLSLPSVSQAECGAGTRVRKVVRVTGKTVFRPFARIRR